MLDIAFTLKCLVALSGLWFLWRSLRHTIVKTPIRNLPGPPPQSWMKGNLGQIYSPKGMSFHQQIAKYGGAVQIHGLYGDEHVYFSDPRALHNIVVKDQHIFEETTMFIEGNKLMFGDGLLSTMGDHHKKQRKLLNPVFSINHMRSITPIFNDITQQLRRVLMEKVKDGEKTINMLDWMSRVALELVGQGGLGYSFDALEETKVNLYSQSVRDLIPAIFSIQVWRQFLPVLVHLGPASFRRRLVAHGPSSALRRLQRIVDIMDDASKEVLESKRKAIAQGDEVVLKQVGQGKDIMSILLRANAAVSEADRLPESEIVGQMTTLIFAAHDTTSSAMSRILHLLCLHPDVQERLRLEITEARKMKGDLQYDDLVALPYLDAVCRETLRLHAPVTFVSRTARAPAVVPLLRPVEGTDGRMITEVPIAQNQNVIVGIAAANRDPAIWGPDADEWKPERWLAPLPSSVIEAHLPGVYSNTMTFLGGGRACIGFKFSQLEMKVVMSLLLEKFKFSLPDQEIVWNLGIILTPSLRGKEKETPHMPLKISLV